MEIIDKSERNLVQVHDIELGHSFRAQEQIFTKILYCSMVITQQGPVEHVVGVNLATGYFYTCPPSEVCMVELVIAKVTVE